MELKIAKKIHIEIKETGTYALSLPVQQFYNSYLTKPI
jgi:hypothetical protein